MKPIIEKYIGKKTFKETIDRFCGNQEYEEVFILFLNDFLTDLQNDDAIEENDTPDSLLEVPNVFIDCYIKERKKGFSKIWSRTRAELKTSFDEHNYVFKCYDEVVKVSKEEALKDLHVFCKLKNGDKRYTDFLIDNVINDGYSERPIEERAADFSKIYKKQIECGKSEIYANKYAGLMAEDCYHEIYCEDYALIYDQSLTQGKSKEYAEQYAEKYACELVDIKSRAGISDDEEMLGFAKEEAKAYINGWEYATANNIKERSLFIDCYSNSYLNTVFSDDPYEWKTKEQCEELALKKALVKFEKLRKLK